MAKVTKQPEPDIRIVGYARVSTRDQNLDMQIDALKEAGVMDDNLHVEKLSAAKKTRPMLDMAIKDLRPGDTFAVWRLDRLARSMRELYTRLDEIKAAGASFRSLTERFDFTSAAGQTSVVHLPRTCKYCGAKMMHYGFCNCADARLANIDDERRAIALRLARLDELEREVLGLKTGT
jgi:hypothetical protein